MKTQHQFALASLCIACATMMGCSGTSDVTDDSTRIEAEMPKIEVGSEPVDLNPATDGDVDIDTPLKGDS